MKKGREKGGRERGRGGEGERREETGERGVRGGRGLGGGRPETWPKLFVQDFNLSFFSTIRNFIIVQTQRLVPHSFLGQQFFVITVELFVKGIVSRDDFIRCKDRLVSDF